jgi:hypothetical protein
MGVFKREESGLIWSLTSIGFRRLIRLHAVLSLSVEALKAYAEYCGPMHVSFIIIGGKMHGYGRRGRLIFLAQHQRIPQLLIFISESY